MTQSQESTVKPLFGFRALMADLADWIREHRMPLGFVLFITLFNVWDYARCSQAKVRNGMRFRMMVRFWGRWLLWWAR